MHPAWGWPMIDVELWAQRFADELKAQNYSENSIVRYVGEARTFLNFVAQQGLAQLSGLTRQHLYAYRNYLTTVPGRRGRKLKAGTQAHRLTAVLVLVRALVRLDYLLVDVSQGVELPRRHASIPRVILSEGETLCLLEGPDLVAAVLPEAQAALQEFSVLSADDDAEDDDI